MEEGGWKKSTSDIVINDNRFHTLPDGTCYPRVTAITGMWPKGQFFEEWLGDAVSYKEAIKERDEKGRRGTRIHEILAEALDKKWTTLRFEDCKVNLEDWKKIISAVRFLKDWQVQPVAVEHFMKSDVLKTAGTADLIATIIDPDDKTKTRQLAVIDWKTGSSLHHDQRIQLKTYATMYKEALIKKCVLVRLGSKHKCGYETDIIEEGDFLELSEDWKACYRMFVRENGLEKKDRTYPQYISLT